MQHLAEMQKILVEQHKIDIIMCFFVGTTHTY